MALGRICVLLGLTPSQAEDMPATDWDFLCRYYGEEPWGAWRDNMHAAIIAREVRRARFPKSRPELKEFMLMAPERRRRGNLTGFVGMLKAMAGGVRKHISEWHPPKRRKRGRSRKTGSTPRGPIRPTPDRARKGK